MSSSRTIAGVPCVGALVLSLLAPGRVALALPTVESPRFVLDYIAPPSCPDRDAFLAALRARTPRPQLATDGEQATHLRIVIEVADDNASGNLDLREPDGTEETRNVSGHTCAEVADALALVAAVMLDPEARTTPHPHPSPSPSPSPTPTPTPTPTATPIAQPPPRRPWLLSLGANLGALSGIGPSIAPIGGGFFDLEHTPRPFPFSTRITLEFARTSSDLRTGTQTYEWLGSTLRLCPLLVPPLPAAIRIAPCGGLQIAGHRGTTSHVVEPSSRLQLWLAPVVMGTVEWEASSAVSLELQGGALFPLRRTRFFLAPNSTIFEIPVVAATAGLAARIRFQ